MNTTDDEETTTLSQETILKIEERLVYRYARYYRNPDAIIKCATYWSRFFARFTHKRAVKRLVRRKEDSIFALSLEVLSSLRDRPAIQAHITTHIL